MFDDSSTTSRMLNHVRISLRNNLKRKYNIQDKDIEDQILKIHGLHKDNFDFIHNIGEIINEKLNDISIDDNSNKNEKTIETINSEIFASCKKAVGYNYLYKVMKDNFGSQEANKLIGNMIDLSLGLSDSTNAMKNYCYALDASKLVTEGRQFGLLYSKPSKRIQSYISALCETVHQLSGHLAGALAIGTIFLDISHLCLYRHQYTLNDLKFNNEIKKFIENEYQQLTHSLCHLSRNQNEAPFSNVSVFDSIKLKNLISEDNYGWYFPKEKSTIFDYCNIDYLINSAKSHNLDINDYIIQYIMQIQKLFLEFFDKGDPSKNGMPIRFPIITFNLTKDENNNLLDQEFIEYISKLDIYRYNIFNSQGSKTASCCFRGDQKVLVLIKAKTQLITIKELIENIPSNSSCRIFHNGFWKEYKKVKVNYEKDWYEIILENGKKVICTEDHQFPILYNKDLQAKDLTIENYLMFNTRSLQEKTSNAFIKKQYLTFNQGFLIGAFLGDGSYISANGEYNGINYSLNQQCFELIKNRIEIGCKEFGFNVNFHLGNIENNVYPLIGYSREFAKFLLKFIPHNIAHNKYFNEEIYSESEEFRKGILMGWYETDGGNSNRCYTTSFKLLEQMETLCTTLGLQCIIDKSDRTGQEQVIIRGEKYNRNYPLYCLRFYDKINKSSDLKYKWYNNSIYFKIKEIKKIENKEKIAYCIEIKNSEPYFTLPNGIITHNCRLINNSDMLEMASSVNSFGGGMFNLGSSRVVTINFNRIALEANNKEEFWNILDSRIENTAKILKSHKDLLKLLTEKGLQFFIKTGWINFNRLFSTFGILGIYECEKTYREKFIIEDNEDIINDILIFLNKKVQECSKKYNIIGNIEQIPGESFAIRLAKADRIIFGKEKVPYRMYSNQFVPLWEDATIWEKLDVDGKYNKLITGGGIVHAQINEKVTPIQAKKIIEYAAKVGCEHFALNSVYTQFEDDTVLMGKYTISPQTNSPAKDYFTRVVGFFTPVSSWNKTRREWEFPKRTFTSLE